MRICSARHCHKNHMFGAATVLGSDRETLLSVKRGFTASNFFSSRGLFTNQFATRANLTLEGCTCKLQAVTCKPTISYL